MDFAFLETGQYKNSPNAWNLTIKKKLPDTLSRQKGVRKKNARRKKHLNKKQLSQYVYIDVLLNDMISFKSNDITKKVVSPANICFQVTAAENPFLFIHGGLLHDFLFFFTFGAILQIIVNN